MSNMEHVATSRESAAIVNIEAMSRDLVRQLVSPDTEVFPSIAGYQQATEIKRVESYMLRDGGDTHTTMSEFNFDPKDCRAIITGGSQGLGLEFGRRLISLGAKVCICDIDSKAGESAVRELREQYGVGADW